MIHPLLLEAFIKKQQIYRLAACCLPTVPTIIYQTKRTYKRREK
jgi:hypothetical protein